MQHKKWLVEKTLQGKAISLLPLKREHAKALVRAASDGQLWNLWYTSVPTDASIDAYIDAALTQQEKGHVLPFVVVENKTQKIIGSTRFCNADSSNKRVEIGYTWYAQSHQKTQSIQSVNNFY